MHKFHCGEENYGLRWRGKGGGYTQKLFFKVFGNNKIFMSTLQSFDEQLICLHL